MKTTRRVLLGAVCTAAILSGCRSLPGPREMTADGLERMPSRRAGGVFRLPGAPFTQYRRLILEPVTVSFTEGWEKSHPETSVREQRRIREEAAKLFREEFERELIKAGKYTFAQDPGTDVLVVAPTITDLDIPAPYSDNMDMRTMAPRSISMHVMGELRDAASGKLVGRVDMFAGGEEYGMHEFREGNKTTNAFEVRNQVREWARLLREALNVAKTERRP
jgi:uncharacterized protein DUF3313